jgi:fatty-acyl-CoA synthase
MLDSFIYFESKANKFLFYKDIMKSTIMDFDLNVNNIFWRIERLYKNQLIISRNKNNMERITYENFTKKVRKLSRFLSEQGITEDSAVGSIAWNTRRHLELYFAVPLMGSVLHTINVRFMPNEIAYVINFAKDRLVFADEDINVSELRDQVSSKFVVMSDDLDSLIDSYEPLEYNNINEKNGAIMCFTSGTTGHPKGVIYSHRSIYIHSVELLAKDVIGISSNDVVMPVVPMFHISAWDLPYATLMTGARLVLPGPRPTSEDLADLISKEKVTIASAAPTVWISFIDYIKREKLDISTLKIAITGGAEPPKGLIKSFMEMGIRTYHAWGMTETEAITTVNNKDSVEDLSKQGIPMPGIEIGLISPDGTELPWDGNSIGELIIRGAWVTGEYFNSPEKTSESIIKIHDKLWFKTGDIAVIYPDGNIKIVDRAKDLIKSGGEWISSVDLENAIMSFEPVLEAIVVGIPDEKWGERPVALVVPKAGYNVKEDDIKKYLLQLNKFPRWWIPDKIFFVNSIPKTSTGKLDKKTVRKELKKLT